MAFDERIGLSDEVTDILKSKLILLSPHQKASKFCDFIVNVLGCCKICNPDREVYKQKYELELDENECKNSIEETYLEMKKFIGE
jgi:hypothetical protein